METTRLAESRRWPPRLGGITVFVYHGLATRLEAELPWREGKYWVSPLHFRKQLRCIDREGYRATLLRDSWNPTTLINRGNSTVALTFDDGRLSDYCIAYPLLLQAGVRAEFFVNTASIGKQGFLGWRQIGEMHRGGMSFQSHSHDHVDLSRLPLGELEWQLKRSKQTLEDWLGSAVDLLAAPYGVLNDKLVELALRIGYRAVCSARSLPARPGAPRVNRTVVYRHTALSDFCQLLDRRLLGFLPRVARAPLYWPTRLLSRARPSRPGEIPYEEPA